jgi:octaprenyl-diphosphate synthase
VTLPLIAAMRRGNEEQRALIRHAIEESAVGELDRIIAIVRETGALEVAHQAAAAEAQRAMSAALQLPPNDHAQALVQLAASLLQRRY